MSTSPTLPRELSEGCHVPLRPQRFTKNAVPGLLRLVNQNPGEEPDDSFEERVWMLTGHGTV